MCIILICGDAYIYSLIRVYHVRVNRFSLAITKKIMSVGLSLELHLLLYHIIGGGTQAEETQDHCAV